MISDTKRSSLTLLIAGIGGLFFFWLTDARWGVLGRWLNADDLIDAINFGRPGTLIGLIGSAIVLMIGLWLITRRTA